MNFDALLKQTGDWFLNTGVQVVLVLIVMAIFLRYSSMVADRFFSSVTKRAGKYHDDAEFQKRSDTLAQILKYVINIAVLLIGAIMILDQVGVEIGPILAAAGVLGLAIGFGAQSLVKDIISGFFILLEDQIRVGDVVDVAGKAGMVEKINLKMTTLRDLGGNVHFVPNGEISVVTNMTKGFSRYVFKVGVAYREDVDQVMQVMREVHEELRQDDDFKDDITEPLTMLGVDEFADSAVVIKAYTTTRPIKQWRVAREYNRRLKKTFDERNIEIPFPHVTFYAGQDKDGSAPPLDVHVQSAPGSDHE
ncbi:MAG: mechanosensitive ion channel family protein [candidate division KSB1 bacterium]|nr:mechanosensitive ion channel family protein [candidate division KSB1 bacterium]